MRKHRLGAVGLVLVGLVSASALDGRRPPGPRPRVVPFPDARLKIEYNATDGTPVSRSSSTRRRRREVEHHQPAAARRYSTSKPTRSSATTG